MTKKKLTKVEPKKPVEKVEPKKVEPKAEKPVEKPVEKTPEKVSGKEILSKKTVIINGKKYEELTLIDGSITLK